MNDRFSGPPHVSWKLAFVIVALGALVSGLFIFERCTSLPARTASTTVEGLERLGRDARNAFLEIAKIQPRVTVNEHVYFEQTRDIAELALVSQRIEVEHEFVHTWAGSSKKLRLHGTFTAKAGFDLHQEISVSVQPNEITVRLPHAGILGVEQNAMEVLEFENGFWNPISGSDVQSEIEALATMARQRATERSLPAEAEQMFRSQLATRLKTPLPIHVIFYDIDARR
ncbi:MAG TPA: DUF4230 domain-containing protein [Chthoniobacterales bacterium]|jgi:hypothetical protein